MATRGYTRKLGLSLDQLRAIELFSVGRNDTEVAHNLNLHRVTVTRWRLYDPFFKVELNRRRKEYWSGATDAMRAVLPAALQTFREQLMISPNRGRLALDLLYRAGVMGTPYSGALASADIGPDSIEDLLDEEVLQHRSRLASTEAPLDASPISDSDRDAALQRLLARANDPVPGVDVESAAHEPAPPEPDGTATTTRMGAFS